MNFGWSSEAQTRIDAARRFAEQTLRGRKPSGGLDPDAWAALGEQGALALPLPKEWGGLALDSPTTVAVFEALGRGGADRGLLFGAGAHLFGCARPIVRHGSDLQRGRFGAELAAGRCIAALAITEAESGSAVAGTRTGLERDGELRLNGSKTLVSNAPDADLFLVLASEAPERGALGLTALLLPRDTPGLRIEPLASATGMRGAPMGRVILDDCRLADDAVLGRPGGGLAVLLTAMRHERTCILAGLLGAAERDLEICVERTRTRGDGKSLFSHQGVSHRLARMKCRLESARSLLYRGAWELDQAGDRSSMPSVVKWTLSETLVECALDVTRIFAGAAWLDEQGMGSALHDVVGTLSASGTSDVQLNAIAAGLKGPEVRA